MSRGRSVPRGVERPHGAAGVRASRGTAWSVVWLGQGWAGGAGLGAGSMGERGPDQGCTFSRAPPQPQHPQRHKYCPALKTRH